MMSDGRAGGLGEVCIAVREPEPSGGVGRGFGMGAGKERLTQRLL